MNVRRSRKRNRLEALVPRPARTIETTLASGYLNANTCVAFLVHRIIHATRNVHKDVDSVAVIANATSHVGSPALRVWSHVNGAVPIMNVP